MLGKLLKYEFKNQARFFLPAWGALIILSFINMIFLKLHFENGFIDFFSGVSVFLYTALGIILFVGAFIMVIYRFNKNLLSDQGYLMFTLPVKSYNHILSKLICSVCYIVFNVFVWLLSSLIVMFDPELFRQVVAEFQKIVVLTFSEFNINYALIFVEALIMCVVFLVVAILIIYMSLAIGHLAQNKRTLWAVAAFVALQVLFAVILTTIGGVFNLLNFDFGVLLNIPIDSLAHWSLWTVIIYQIIKAAALFLFTNKILSQNLNLS